MATLALTFAPVMIALALCLSSLTMTALDGLIINKCRKDKACYMSQQTKLIAYTVAAIVTCMLAALAKSIRL